MAITAAAQKEAFRLTQNVTLIGPPGSGKGYYGRLLSAAWQKAPLYSASRILRSSATPQQDDQLNSGTLVDCAVVSRTILNFLQERHPVDSESTSSFSKNEDSIEMPTPTPCVTHFLMDGFPRTCQQIQYMRNEWPEPLQITHAIHLQIPDHVCRAKMMGRRVCTLCHGEPNSAHVEDADGFFLPPTRPPHCTMDQCQPDIHWKARADDVDEAIVQKRLQEYRYHEEALLGYYSTSPPTPTTTTNHNEMTHQAKNTHDAADKQLSRPNVCSITPFRGIRDFPEVQRTLERWLQLQQQP